jgi:hypothetical protein
MNGGPISWKLQRQDSPTLSTSKAECMLATLCRQETVYIETVYIRTILRDFRVPQSEPTVTYEDNLACMPMYVNRDRRKYL